MISTSLQFVLGADYDDGSGNSGDYSLTIIAFGDLADVLIKEKRWYRPKCWMIVPPLAEETYALALNNTDTGSPPATVNVTIGNNGVITAASAHVKYLYVRLAVKITTIDFEAIHDEARSQTLLVAPPFTLSDHGRMIIRGLSTYYAGSTGFQDWDNGDNMADVDYVIDDGFADVNDIIYYEFLWDLTNMEASEVPNLQDVAVITADTVLLNTSWHTGGLIEKSGQLVLNYLGITSGIYAPLVGTFLEYQKDGEWGDLDLPFSTFAQRCPAA